MAQKTPQNRVLFRHCPKLLTLGVFIAISILLPLLALIPVDRATAATSSTINFQARLLGAAGSMAPDGYYNVEFKLYNASSSSGSSQGSCTGDSNCLWTETRTGGNTVRVANGYLTVSLGSVTTFPGTINWDQELWLTMNVGGTGGSPSWDGEMSPRLKLTAVPYAFKAGQLAKLTGANTSTLDFATQTGARSLLLPDESGSLCVQGSTNCGFAAASGSSSYIQNQLAGAQNANFYIQSALGATIDPTAQIRLASGQTGDLLQFRNSSGTLLSKIDAAGNLAMSNFVDLAGTGSYINLTANDVAIYTRNAANQGVSIIGAASQTGNLLQLKDNSGNVNGSFNALGSQLTLGRIAASGTVTQGKLVLADGTNDNFGLTLQTTTLTGNRTLTLPNETGIICTTGSVCSGYQATGNYLVQAPTSTAQNSITPTTNSVVALTVNATSGTAAVGAIINQSQAADSLQINTTNTSGTQTNGLLFNRNGAGGTTTNGINITNTAGTLTNGLSFTGTIGTDINRSSGVLTLQGTGGVTVTAGGTSTLALDTAGAGTINVGNSANASTINLGNNGSSGGQTINIGNGGLMNNSINIGTNTLSNIALVLGSVGGTSSTLVQAGTGNLTLATNSATAQIIAKSNTNSTTAFQIQNASASPIFNVDTTNLKVGIGTATPNTYNGALVIDRSGYGWSHTDQTVTLGTWLGTDGGLIQGTVGTQSNHGLGFYTNDAATAMILLTNGNINLGRDSADNISANSARLQVRGTGSGSALLKVTDTTAADFDVMTIADEGVTTFKTRTNSTTGFQVQNASAVATLNVDTSNQRVGINTTAPSSTLEVKQGNLAPGTVTNSAGSPNVTGSGTSFLSTFRAGDTFTVSSTSNTCTVLQLLSDTSLVCNANLASAATNSAYTFTQQARFAIVDNGNSTVSGTLAVTNASAGRILSVIADPSDGLMKFQTNTVGNTASEQSLSDSGNNNLISSSVYNSGPGGQVSSLRVYFPTVAASPNNHVKVAIYDNTGSGGLPGALVTSASAPSTVVTAATWTTVSLGGTYTLKPNTNYWLAFNVDSGSTTYNYANGASGVSQYQTMTYGNSFPSSFGTPTANSTSLYTVYANYSTIADSSGGVDALTISDNNDFTFKGAVLLQGSYDSTSALEVKRANGNSMFIIDTLNNTIGTSATSWEHTGIFQLNNTDVTSSLNVQNGGQTNTITAQNSSGVDVFTIANAGATLFRNSTDSTTAFRVQNAAGTTTAFNVDTTNGRVGIGISSPADELHIDKGTATDSILRFTAGTTTGQTSTDGFLLGIDAAGSGFVYNHENHPIYFATNNTIRMKLSNGGNLAVGGDFEAGQELEVNGDIRLDANGTATTNGLCHSGAGSNTTFTDRDIVVCSSIPSDLAEWYETKPGVEPGDLVVTTGDSFTYSEKLFNPRTGEQTGETVNSTISVLDKGTRDSTDRMIGVVSTSPYQVMGEAVKDSPNAQNAQPIALSGRVPVKVSTDNGSISIGDKLTASSTPGVAMKATETGMVIGTALAAYDGSDIGKVMVFVNNSFYTPPAQLGQIKSAVWSGAIVSNDTEFTASVLFSGPVRFTGAATFEGDMNIIGKVKLSGDQVNQAVLAAGRRRVDIAFRGRYPGAPYVTATPREFLTGQYRVTDVTDTGFVIETSVSQPHDVHFDWHALMRN